jgi:hypothetical protein
MDYEPGTILLTTKEEIVIIIKKHTLTYKTGSLGLRPTFETIVKEKKEKGYLIDVLAQNHLYRTPPLYFFMGKWWIAEEQAVAYKILNKEDLILYTHYKYKKRDFFTLLTGS